MANIEAAGKRSSAPSRSGWHGAPRKSRRRRLPISNTVGAPPLEWSPTADDWGRLEAAYGATFDSVLRAAVVRFVARLSRLVLGYDDEGDEISTLIVDAAEEAQKASPVPASKSVPKSHRLLMDIVAEALSEAGAEIQAFGTSGPKVRAVAERHIRKRYFDRIAEQAEPDEDKDKLYDRRRQAFKRAVKAAIDAKLLVADNCKGERFIWLP
jgi:hypothetical protein